MTEKCGGWGNAKRVAQGFEITTGCSLPKERCILQQLDLCPRSVTKTFAQMSEETDGRISPRRMYDLSDSLIPQFNQGATQAVQTKCEEERSK